MVRFDEDGGCHERLLAKQKVSGKVILPLGNKRGSSADDLISFGGRGDGEAQLTDYLQGVDQVIS